MFAGTLVIWPNSLQEVVMYAAIRQGKAKPGHAEELTRTIRGGDPDHQ